MQPVQVHLLPHGDVTQSQHLERGPQGDSQPPRVTQSFPLTPQTPFFPWPPCAGLRSASKPAGRRRLCPAQLSPSLATSQSISGLQLPSRIPPQEAARNLLRLNYSTNILGVPGPRRLRYTWTSSPRGPQSNLGTDLRLREQSSGGRNQSRSSCFSQKRKSAGQSPRGAGGAPGGGESKGPPALKEPSP